MTEQLRYSRVFAKMLEEREDYPKVKQELDAIASRRQELREKVREAKSDGRRRPFDVIAELCVLNARSEIFEGDSEAAKFALGCKRLIYEEKSLVVNTLFEREKRYYRENKDGLKELEELFRAARETNPRPIKNLKEGIKGNMRYIVSEMVAINDIKRKLEKTGRQVKERDLIRQKDL